jgi:hypothetical protein
MKTVNSIKGISVTNIVFLQMKLMGLHLKRRATCRGDAGDGSFLRGIAVNTLFCLATQNQLSREGDVSFT